MFFPEPAQVTDRAASLSPSTPEPLTIGRADLPAALQHVRQRDAGPAFVGPEGSPEAVLLSHQSYSDLLDDAARARRQSAVTEAVVSVRADGADPGPVGRVALQRYVRGDVTADEAVAEVIAHFRRT